MLLMSSLLLYALVALVQVQGQKIHNVKYQLKEIKCNIMINNETKYFGNNPENHDTDKLLQSLSENNECSKCSMCTKLLHKRNELKYDFAYSADENIIREKRELDITETPNYNEDFPYDTATEANNENTKKNKRKKKKKNIKNSYLTLKSTRSKSKKTKKRQKSVTVTKYFLEGLVYALKIKENTPDNSKTGSCFLHSIKNTFPCDSSESNYILSMTNEKTITKNDGHKFVRHASVETELPEVTTKAPLGFHYNRLPDTTNDMIPKIERVPESDFSHTKRQITSSQVNDNLLTSLEDLY